MTAVRRAARVIAFYAALAAIVAVLYSGHALIAVTDWLFGRPRWQWDGTSERRRGVLARLAARARSLPARRCRTEPRHAIPHPRPWQFPGIDGGSVPTPIPWPKSMPKRPEETVIDECLLVPMGRPFIDYRRNGRRSA